MPPAARLGDMHTCPMVTPGTPPVPHVGGPIMPACCPTVLIGGMPAARVTDMCTCVGPPDVIVKGSPTVLIGGLLAARLGDNTAHGGVIVIGCPNVMIGDAGGGGGGGGGGAAGGGTGSAGGGAGTGGAGGAAQSSPPAAVMSAFAAGKMASISAVPPEQVGPLQPAEKEEKKKKKKTWIGIELKDFDGQPMPNHDFQVTLEGGQVLRGRTDDKGHARFENLDPDSGNVAFTQLTEIKDAPPEQAGETATPEPDPRSIDYDALPIPSSEEDASPEFAGFDEETPE